MFSRKGRMIRPKVLEVLRKRRPESLLEGMRRLVFLGGDRLKVLLALVEASANAETEDWIWDTGAALDVANAAVAGKMEVSFAPPMAF